MVNTPQKGIYKCFTESELHSAYENMTIFSDVIANEFFLDRATTQHILRAIIERDDLVVTNVKTQNQIDNALGHSVRFDVLAIDAENNYYDIEIQNVSHDDLLMRADFYGAALKMRYFNKRKSYSEIPRVYVIFFVKDGKYCDNKLVNQYCFKDSSNRDLNFGTRIYCVNGSLHNETPVGKITHDFSCTDASAMYDKVIANRFDEVKQGKELKKMDAFTQMVFSRGEEYGKTELKFDIARNLLAKKMSGDEIAEVTGLSLDQVKRLELEEVTNR